MANSNSNLIANTVAVPAVQNIVSKSGGRMRIAADSFTSVDWHTPSDTITLCRLPSNAVIHSIKIGTGDLGAGSGAIFDLGFYTDGPAGTTEHADDILVLADDYACANAIAANTEVRWAADADMSTAGKAIWELTNSEDNASDTQRMYDLVMTAGHADVQDAIVSFCVFYTVD